MINALTIDVEDYFHVTAFERYVRAEEWDLYPLRVQGNTMRILDFLDLYALSATFFVLGWVAERIPSLVREIRQRGHEIACHGYGHQLVYRQSPAVFRQDVSKARKILEDITGDQIHGYRAPSYSITSRSLWALDILLEEGFSYDSSIFPITHDIYGIPGGKRFPHEISTNSGTIREFPLSTLQLACPGWHGRLPIAGGGYLRLLPAAMVERAIRSINVQERQPVVVYFHPWEIDPRQPRIKASLKSRFRHYLNLELMEGKIQRLLAAFQFASVRSVLDSMLPAGAGVR